LGPSQIGALEGLEMGELLTVAAIVATAITAKARMLSIVIGRAIVINAVEEEGESGQTSFYPCFQKKMACLLGTILHTMNQILFSRRLHCSPHSEAKSEPF
jgi:hypothetical protein